MKPILFNTEMVKAILDGRKTVTRRLVKPQPSEHQIHRLGYCIDGDKRDIGKFCFGSHEHGGHVLYVKPPYKAGDILYVRETWQEWGCDKCASYDCTGCNGSSKYAYKATGDWDCEEKWRPSIFMPREAARIFLRVTNVRVERLQEISVQDAKDEGIKVHANGCIDGLAYGCYNGDNCVKNICQQPIKYFHDLWDSLNAKRGYGWESNPWVWVIEFERISKEEAYAGNIKED